VTNYSIKNVTVPSFNFAEVAKAVRPAVVHVKTYATQDVPRSFPFDFYGEGDGMEAPVRGSGSGVIFSDDGYIVTNNHVVAEAEEIDVVLQNKRKYRAEIVGTDPNTDLAVLKIDAEEELSYIRLGNSDDVQVGEWVLAVGNPFNLTSTVTAGIVSAKARNINLLGGGSAIESFIQTDAAVNPGNSGGALVDAEGKLVGINTAIASRTGSYTGYSFAVPVNITDKVVTDIIQYGEVQRGFIGVQIRDVNAELAESKDLEVLKGVYVMGLMENGAAKEAGIQEGDVIVALNDEPVSSVPELQEKVSLMRPGDEVEVTVMRDGKKLEKTMTLKNKEGKAELQATTRSELEEMLAAEFKPVSEQTKEKLGIEHGVRVEKLEKGSKLAEVGIEENFVITYINKRPIHAKEDILKLLMGREGGVFIEGVHPDGRKDYYAFGLDS
jgi:Do/DeqQ family serine protease